ncbi:hypothetical protein KX729_29345 [Rhizobium sp. XQZ8]|uniref:hypothetical protein n=1 Tax=Rhizobium populisoli TaxID=2859785 RepID=UPI001CA517D1|nr:hypothetical protein [Rhizobium populisoli]MBW6425523.1 hypothetical protein [Rhizobium populisoli]
MSEPSNSPAVQSMREEQDRQRGAKSASALEKGLEATFPASDPVSAAITSIPAGRAETADVGSSARAAELAADRDYPRVDAALNSQSLLETEILDASEEVRALRRDVARLRETLLEVAEGGVAIMKAEARSAVRDVKARVRQRPLAAVGVAALIGYVWGLTR